MDKGIKTKITKFFASFALAFMIFTPHSAFAAGDGVVVVRDTAYATLEEAIANAGAGETVTLQADLDLSYLGTGGHVFNFASDTTFDLNGHTITSYNFGAIYTGVNLTIKNGNFATVSANDSYALFVGDEADTDNVLLENLNTDGGINIYNATNVTLQNVNATAHRYYTVWADEHAMITIKSGNYNSGATGTDIFGISQTGGSYIYVDGGNFTVDSGGLALGGSYVPPVIYGGTFNVDPSGYLADGAKVSQDSVGLYVVNFDKNIEVEEVDPDKNVTTPEIGVSNAEIAKEILLGSLDSELAGRKNIDVRLEIQPLIVEENTKAEFERAATAVSSGIKVTDFFDIAINVFDADSDTQLTTLSELNQPLPLSVLLPESLQNHNSELIRKYYILRKHHDKIDILDARLADNGKMLNFSSDKFSTYAIAYVDSPKDSGSTGGSTTGPGTGGGDSGTKPDAGDKDDSWTNVPNSDKTAMETPASDETIPNPNTGDDIAQNLALLVTSLAGLIGTIISYKKIA